MSRHQVGDYLPRADCGKMGYTDQRTSTPRGYICVRCARPDIDWSQYDAQSIVIKKKMEIAK